MEDGNDKRRVIRRGTRGLRWHRVLLRSSWLWLIKHNMNNDIIIIITTNKNALGTASKERTPIHFLSSIPIFWRRVRYGNNIEQDRSARELTPPGFPTGATLSRRRPRPR